MEGIYLSALKPLIEEKIQGRTCGAVGMTSSSTLALGFGCGWLHLHAKPDCPDVWWTEKASTVLPSSPSWEHHLKGAPVTIVSQQGADRVLEIYFASRSPYDAGGVKLLFEATGRNANLILVREKDNRILSCLRRVLSGINRFRSISPGVVYKSPPSSGFPPSEWGSDAVQQLLQAQISPKLLYQNLEGVGPISAKAIIAHSNDVAATVGYLGRRLTESDFSPWQTEFGAVPIPLGKGKPVENPLSPPLVETKDLKKEHYHPLRIQLGSILHRKLAADRKRIQSSQKSLCSLASPDELRSWGNLLLTNKNKLTKGMTEVVLTDWDGAEICICLKQSLTPVENAGRYFRKAGKIHLEKNRLEERMLFSIERTINLESIQNRLETMSDEEATKLLEEFGKPEKKQTGAPLEYILDGGWRCLVGRNAKQNDHLTFKIAARDDIWMHARGVTGAHVILKRDGRADNPSAQVLDQAAHVAAKHSSSNGVIPVDWTLARYVRRLKGGGPGQVVYIREKTLFALRVVGPFDK
jgi:predicted ribosome quality control (RQC) complex YloA/Tae2 family protein